MKNCIVNNKIMLVTAQLGIIYFNVALSLACVDGILHPARELPHVVFCFNCLNMELVNQGHEVQLIVYHMLFIYRQYCLGRYGNRITFKHSLHTAWQSTMQMRQQYLPIKCLVR